jgi:hypothetical protein
LVGEKPLEITSAPPNLSLLERDNMKTYNTKLDEYGYPVDLYSFLCDTHLMSSGTKGEAVIWMKIWNCIARIFNFLNGN